MICSATGFMNVTRPPASVAMTPSPMLSSVVTQRRSLSRRRRSTPCRWSAISMAITRSFSWKGFST